MNPEEMKEVQQLQELLTKFNEEASYITVSTAHIFEVGDEGKRIGVLRSGHDDMTMFFTQSK